MEASGRVFLEGNSDSTGAAVGAVDEWDEIKALNADHLDSTVVPFGCAARSYMQYMQRLLYSRI